MTEWKDKNGTEIKIGAVVDVKGVLWNVGSYRKNTLRLWRLSKHVNPRALPGSAYPGAVVVVSGITSAA